MAEAFAQAMVDYYGADLPTELVYMTFDRPFVYAVIDLETSLPLFLGRVDDPSKQ